jgi:hypothetical protein
VLEILGDAHPVWTPGQIDLQIAALRVEAPRALKNVEEASEGRREAWSRSRKRLDALRADLWALEGSMNLYGVLEKLAALEEAVATAAAAEGRKRAPHRPKEGPRLVLIGVLANMYEECTGRPASSSRLGDFMELYEIVLNRSRSSDATVRKVLAERVALPGRARSAPARGTRKRQAVR